MPKTCDIACVCVYVCVVRACVYCVRVCALVYVVKSRQSTPTSATIRVDPFGEGRMGESCLPHSVLHEKSTHPKKTVRASRTPNKSQELGVVQTHQNPRVCAISG